MEGYIRTVWIESLKITSFLNQYIVTVSNKCLLSNLTVSSRSQKHYYTRSTASLLFVLQRNGNAEGELQGPASGAQALLPAPPKSSRQYSAAVADHFSWPHGLIFSGRHNGSYAQGFTTHLQLHQGITPD